ncbi:transposase family protein [Arthrobacter oryzae]
MAGCPACGVVAVGHGRRRSRLHDLPCMGRPVRLIWAKRLWRCPDEHCPTQVFSEQHALAGKRAILTRRAISWATDALQKYDTSVSALAHQLGVSWRSCGTASKPRRGSGSTGPHGSEALMRSALMSMSGHTPGSPVPAWSPASLTTPATPTATSRPGCWTWSRSGRGRPTPTG